VLEEGEGGGGMRAAGCDVCKRMGKLDTLRILQNIKSCRLLVLFGRELNLPKHQISACLTAPVRSDFPARTGEAYCLSGRQIRPGQVLSGPELGPGQLFRERPGPGRLQDSFVGLTLWRIRKGV